LPTLPIRQRALIETILDGLSAQAPKHLKSALESYSNELAVRGVQPILGLLRDMAAIIEADVGAPNARREWLEAGMEMAFSKFFENDELFTKHFPLNLKRDQLYAGTPIDEDAATGPALSKPFEDVAKATEEAHAAGMTTDEFVKIVSSLSEFARVVSTMPPSEASPWERGETAESTIPILSITPDDRISPAISPKKRTILTGIGFFERAYSLIASTASLISLAQSAEFMATLHKAIEALSRFLK
jgi:hypothetical protein